MTPYYQTERATLYFGDAFELLAQMPANSVHAAVLDGPYGIRFMGKAWDGADIQKRNADRMGCAHDPAKKAGDNGGHRSIAAEAGKYSRGVSANQQFQLWTEAWAHELIRVLKPGAHLVSFGSTRTYHRMTCGIEDAGFEIRDQLAWTFGSGFPKSHNLDGAGDGWGTALKPAWEPICLARKPIDGTVAENFAAHGTAALNIDACRIESERPTGWSGAGAGGQTWNESNMGLGKDGEPRPVDGRWPANLAHDGSDEVLAMFPAEAGAFAPVLGSEPSAKAPNEIYGQFDRTKQETTFHGDSGSAARFFYCAKATAKDREEGLGGFPEMMVNNAVSRASQIDGKESTNGRGSRFGPRANIHPTVKPVALMRWLCRMVTPPGGTIIDHFCGSGSTGKAALLEGFNFIGVEKEAMYLPIIRARIIEAIGPLFAELK